MTFNPISGNPILDAWLAAWTNGLNLTTQMTSSWLGGQRSSNPWAAMTGAMTGTASGPLGAVWPMASMAGAGAANPWAAFGGGTANNPFASLAGLQSLMSLAMAPWGGAAPQMGGMPWPWNTGNAANLASWGGMGGWPAAGQRMPLGAGSGWPLGWPMSLSFPGMPGMTAAAATPALPWPWSQFFPSPQGAAAPNFGWPQGFMGGRAGAPAAAESDPMGFGQAMKFWQSLMPAAIPAGSSRASKPEPAPAPVNAAPDLTKLFPWMAWMK